MTLTAILTNMTNTVRAAFQSNDTTPSGADAVRRAIHEMGSVGEGMFEATLGEPTIEPNQGSFTSDPKVVIPVENTMYGSAGTLVYDIPQGPNHEPSQFLDLLDAYDLDIAELGQLEGEPVPVQYTGGNIIVMWDQVGDE